MADVMGWLGAVMLLLAYGLVSAKQLMGDSAHYQLLNVIGGTLLAINTAYHTAYPSALLNVVWVVIGLWTIARKHTGLRAIGTRWRLWQDRGSSST